MSGESSGSRRGAVRSLCLQWSPGPMSGESNRLIGERDLARSPSMEPRTDVRGEPEARGRVGVAAAPVQWSPGPMSGERRRPWRMVEQLGDLQWSPGPMSGESGGHAPRPARGEGLPSMEPRTDVRGEFSAVGSSTRTRVRFNGAPDRCPGRDDDDRKTTRQRHPASMEPRTDVRGEMVAVDYFDSRIYPASMEPRTDVRGEREEAAPPRVFQFSLQWSPGPMSGESRARAPGQGHRSFNGAPDRCPGRGGWLRWPGATRTAFNGAPDRCPGRDRRET